MARSVPPTRPVRTRRARVLLTTLITAALAVPTPAAAATAPTRETPRSAPLLNPKDPGGAWMGYSMDKSGPQSRSRSGPPIPPRGLPGMDVSKHQGAVDWDAAWDAGARFAYVKATEGPDYSSDTFLDQFSGANDEGMVHGAYHFALPDRSPGAQQANYFVDHGGMWRPGTGTMPGVVDMETNPYGDRCYRMTPQALSAWLVDFSNTYNARTGRFPVIYTTTKWWNSCAGANPGFAVNSPLWVARFAPAIGPLPAGWAFHTIWQSSNVGPLPGDQDLFNGTPAQLNQFAG